MPPTHWQQCSSPNRALDSRTKTSLSVAHRQDSPELLESDLLLPLLKLRQIRSQAWTAAPLGLLRRFRLLSSWERVARHLCSSSSSNVLCNNNNNSNNNVLCNNSNNNVHRPHRNVQRLQHQQQSQQQAIRMLPWPVSVFRHRNQRRQRPLLRQRTALPLYRHRLRSRLLRRRHQRRQQRKPERLLRPPPGLYRLRRPRRPDLVPRLQPFRVRKRRPSWPDSKRKPN